MVNLPGIPDLQDCFEKQKYLLQSYYISKQGDPPFTGDINSPEYQKVIKNYMDYFIEELVEVNLVYTEMVTNLSQHQISDLRKLVGDFNMELADTFHFLLDIMLYAHIEADSINNYYNQLLQERGLEALNFEDFTLKTAFAYARHANAIQATLVSRMSYKVYRGGAPEEIPAGSLIHMENLQTQARFSWEIVKGLKVVAQLLKNKPWVQSTHEVNYQNFARQLMEVWLTIFCFYDYVGLDEIKLADIYMDKNRINLERIKNKR